MNKYSYNYTPKAHNYRAGKAKSILLIASLVAGLLAGCFIFNFVIDSFKVNPSDKDLATYARQLDRNTKTTNAVIDSDGNVRIIEVR